MSKPVVFDKATEAHIRMIEACPRPLLSCMTLGLEMAQEKNPKDRFIFPADLLYFQAHAVRNLIANAATPDLCESPEVIELLKRLGVWTR